MANGNGSSHNQNNNSSSSNNNNNNSTMGSPAAGGNKEKGQLSLTIDELAHFQGNSSSELKTIGGLEWRFELEKVAKKGGNNTANKHELKLHIYCNEEVHDRLWWCQAQLICRSKLFRLPPCKYNYKPFYNFNGCIQTLDEVESELHLNNAVGSTTLSVEICVLRAVIEDLPPLDMTLSLNNGFFFVNEFILSAYSKKFRQFFANCVRDKGALPLRDVAPQHLASFKLMVYGLHVFGSSMEEKDLIDTNSAMDILKLAVEYEIPIWRNICIHFLLEQSKMNKMELLEFAEAQNIEKLKEHCLANIDALEFTENHRRYREIYDRLGKRTREEFDAKLAESSKKMRRGIRGDSH